MVIYSSNYLIEPGNEKRLSKWSNKLQPTSNNVVTSHFTSLTIAHLDFVMKLPELKITHLQIYFIVIYVMHAYTWFQKIWDNWYKPFSIPINCNICFFIVRFNLNPYMWRIICVYVHGQVEKKNFKSTFRYLLQHLQDLKFWI